MTNEYLESILLKLNGDITDYPEILFLQPISDNVSFAKLWEKIPDYTDEIVRPNGAYNVYLIKNEEAKYVGIVLDMSNDLHWFVFESYRGKGYLTVALKDIVLKHLFQSRASQRISIDANLPFFELSERVALSLGFIKQDDNSYLLDGANFKKPLVINSQYNTLNDEKINFLKKKINFLRNSLMFIKSELEMSFNNNIDFSEFDDVANDVDNLIRVLHDTWQDYNDKDLNE